MDTLLSIITMYNYDQTIFDEMVIPPEMDAELLTDNIMLELGELELLYNNPEMMKFAIGRWSAKELKKWIDLYATTVLEYNPIENYDRTETFTETEARDLEKNNTQTRSLTGSNNETRNLTGSNNETRSLTGSDNETRTLAASNLETRDLTTGVTGTTTTTDNDVRGGSDSTKREVSAYNSAVLAIESIDTQTLGSTNNKTVNTSTTQTGTDAGTVTTASTDTGTVNKAKTDTGTVNVAMTDAGSVNTATSDTGTVADETTDKGTVENVRSGRAHGNIGVTTTQQMIEQERSAVKFNMYDYIVESFKQRFCILVY